MHHVYDKNTGLFTGHSVHCNDKTVDMNLLIRRNYGEGVVGIPDVAEPHKHLLDLTTGELVPHVPAPTAGELALQTSARIAELEKQQHEIVRQMLLKMGNEQLAAIDNEIKNLRETMK